MSTLEARLESRFLSPEELSISAKEFLALCEVLKMLEQGRLEHSYVEHDEAPTQVGFNMNIPAERDSCGTICCIGGWASVIMQGGLRDEKGHYQFDGYTACLYVDRSLGDLRDLYYPPIGFDWDGITPAHASRALRNFLTTGRPDWETVCADLL